MQDRPLRILLLSTSDLGGGAAEACRRLVEAFAGLCYVEVRLLVLHRGSDLSQVGTVASTPLRKLKGRYYFLSERLEIYLRNGRSRHDLFRVSTAHYGFDVSKHPWVKWADVLHLHWINQGFLSLSSLERLSTLGKPIFVTLHDLWMATGICHLPLEFSQDSGATLCPHYEQGCGFCPLLRSTVQEDLSRQVQRTKGFLSGEMFHYIAVSRAEARLFSRSPLMRGRPAPIVLPNPIDLELFSPDRVKEEVTYEWHSPRTRYLLLVAARLDDEVKGGRLLREICTHLRADAPELAEELCLLLVGTIKEPTAFADYPISTRTLGSIRDRRDLAMLYRLSSVVLSTSVYETQGQTLVEGLAMGTPAISFACGGPEDIIHDGENGFLIPPFDTHLYAQRLAQLLRAREAGGFTPSICRQSVQGFAADAIAVQLLSLYEYALSLSIPKS
ncbi:glycosyltransferase [uncultured Porphyromonas sp.]|uniref:glycosyltransferase n=1 Tax=uncultured Porphyromonas sp. TaxID=159274 RepID=UPI00260F0F2B|nr:glycosyltransferase [uncultured Porphyromonas sp.]